MGETIDTAALALSLPDLVYEALRFANFAAGEGLCAPVDQELARDPDLFLSEYTDRSGDDDWDTLPARIRDALAALLRGVVDGPKVVVTSNPHDWGWWAGPNEEFCTIGPCGSRDEVIAAARGERLGEWQDDDGRWKLSFHICEAEQRPLRLSDWIDAERMLERAEEALSDSDRVGCDGDDGPWFEATKEQEADFERRIVAACDEWQAAHGLVFTCMTFSASRNHEHVVCSHPLDDAHSPPLSTTKEG